MTITVIDQRPPFVRFEERSVEDRDATIAQGRMMMKSETWALIHAIGSRDVVERQVDEWIATLRSQVNRGMYPAEWLAAFEKKYAEHKSGQEPSVDGTHVREWAAIDRATAQNLISASILTVEDVAAMNEQAMKLVGMHARTLKQKAQDWLKMADKRKGAAELDQLRGENANLKARLESLEAQIAKLAAEKREAA
jgi:hypothetical protein